MEKKYKYSVITFITNGYEVLREVRNKQDDVEYILVTDDKNLKSETWKVVYEPLLDTDSINGVVKMFLIKYNAYKYVSSDVFIRIDHSMQILDSLDWLIDLFNEGNYDVLTAQHYCRYLFEDEYDAWMDTRGLDWKFKAKFFEKARLCDYDYNWPGMFETTVQIYRKSGELKDFFKDMLYCVLDGSIYGECDKNDQCYNTVLLMSKYNNRLKTKVVSNNLLWNKSLQICHHGCYVYQHDRRRDLEGYTIQYGYWRGERLELEFFENNDLYNIDSYE